MDEFISREVALMKLMQDGCNAKNLQSISDIPAADVAPVVRCKDCVHCGYCGKETNLEVMGFYGFCSRGERKEER